MGSEQACMKLTHIVIERGVFNLLEALPDKDIGILFNIMLQDLDPRDTDIDFDKVQSLYIIYDDVRRRPVMRDEVKTAVNNYFGL